MTKIDLIPPELIERHQARQLIVLISVGFGVLFGIAIFLYVIIYAQGMMASRRVDAIKVEQAKVEKATKDLNKFQERKNLIDERKKFLAGIAEDQVYWSGVLNNISMVMPNDVWLQSFSADLTNIMNAKQQAKGGQAFNMPEDPPITITGIALDHAAVARWLVHLSEVNQFRDVWMTSAKEANLSEKNKQKVILFTTTVQLSKFKEWAEKAKAAKAAAKSTSATGATGATGTSGAAK